MMPNAWRVRSPVILGIAMSPRVLIGPGRDARARAGFEAEGDLVMSGSAVAAELLARRLRVTEPRRCMVRDGEAGKGDCSSIRPLALLHVTMTCGNTKCACHGEPKCEARGTPCESAGEAYRPRMVLPAAALRELPSKCSARATQEALNTSEACG